MKEKESIIEFNDTTFKLGDGILKVKVQPNGVLFTKKISDEDISPIALFSYVRLHAIFEFIEFLNENHIAYGSNDFDLIGVDAVIDDNNDTYSYNIYINIVVKNGYVTLSVNHLDKINFLSVSGQLIDVFNDIKIIKDYIIKEERKLHHFRKEK